MGELGRQLPRAPDRGHHALAHGWWRLGRRGQGQGGGDLPQAADLGCARLASAQVPGKPVLLRLVIERIEHVRAGQRVQVGAEQLHQPTPRQSRSRMSPSRILVLIVPTAVPRSAATSR